MINTFSKNQGKTLKQNNELIDKLRDYDIKITMLENEVAELKNKLNMEKEYSNSLVLENIVLNNDLNNIYESKFND